MHAELHALRCSDLQLSSGAGARRRLHDLRAAAWLSQCARAGARRSDPCLTIALYPVWPVVPNESVDRPEFAGWIAIEAAFGLCIGLLVGFLSDIMLLFGQMCGLQAGFSFASTIDPDTQADSPGLERHCAIGGRAALCHSRPASLHHPHLCARASKPSRPRNLILNPRWGEVLIMPPAQCFPPAFVSLCPLSGLMAMVDIALALLGRINSQLQLSHLAMPLKMLAALATISLLLMLFPAVYSDYADRLFRIAAVVSRR